MLEFIQRIPLLLITAALLIGGVFENDIGSGSQAMLAAGFICLGAWLSVEVQSWHRRMFSRYGSLPLEELPDADKERDELANGTPRRPNDLPPKR